MLWLRGLQMIAALCAPVGALAADAKAAFASHDSPSGGPPAVHGGYAVGCLAGAVALPETGPTWQAMRLSRNRNWAHPDTVAFVERLSRAAREAGWPGLYVGDLSQPRGGPMRSGHRSHQSGLDVDIWMRRPHSLTLSRAERERIGSVSMVAPSRVSVSAAWTAEHGALIRAAAEDPAVDRIFVNAAMKNALCDDAAADDSGWLRRVRPWWGHDHHMHVRLRCPSDSPDCAPQAPPPPGSGCDETLAWWFTDEALNPAPAPGAPPRRALTLADLPAACAPIAETR